MTTQPRSSRTVKEALHALRALTECPCSTSRRERDEHSSICLRAYADDVETLAAALEQNDPEADRGCVHVWGPCGVCHACGQPAQFIEDWTECDCEPSQSDQESR